MTNTGDDQLLPSTVLEDVVGLSRRERTARSEREATAYAKRRDKLLAEYDAAGRIRPDDDGDVLVVYPAAWLEDGIVQLTAIDDTDVALEIPLEGAGDPDDWEAVDAENRALAAAVADQFGAVHAANAHALATFASNHYAKPITSLTAGELTEFRREYFRRNAWPTDAQRAAVDESILLVYETAGEPVPPYQ